MTPNETEAFAALRMHVAHLHNALAEAIEGLQEQGAPIPAQLERWVAALEQSEPAVRDLLAEADRDAKLQVCREQLGAILPKARNVVVCWAGVESLEEPPFPLQESMGATIAELAAVLP